MSSTYTSPNNLYSQVIPWPAWIIIPDDGDPFIAQSANLFEKTLNDRNTIVLGTYAKLPGSTSKIKAVCYDGITISIYPFTAEAAFGGTYYLSRQTTLETIDVSNLTPAGSFAADTWYYVYQNLSMVFGNPIFSTIISTGAPHQYLLYKDNAGTQDLTNKYLFSFRTDGAANIIPFTKDGTYTQYFTPRRMLNNGVSVAPVVVDLTPFIPPHSRNVYSLFDFINENAMSDNRLYIYNSSGSSQIFRCPALGSTHQPFTFNVLSINAVQEFLYAIHDTTMPLSSVNIDCLGYYE